MYLKRMKWAISFDDVGFLRLYFLNSIICLIVITLLYGLAYFTNNISYFQNPFGDNYNLSTVTLFFVSIISLFVILLFLSLIISLLSKWKKRPNSTWFDIKNFGEKQSQKVLDNFLIIITLLFLIVRVINGKIEWFHFFIAFCICVAIIVNRFSKADRIKIVPIILPEPDPAPLLKDDDNYVIRSYEWSSMAGGPFKIDNFQISENEYLSAQKINKKILDAKGKYESNNDFVARINDGITNDLRRLIQKIAETHLSASSLKRLDNIFQFVHAPNFLYSYDKDSTGYEDYARFPVETIVDKTGDCECLAILLSALFKLHGYNVALIFLSDHCMAGVEIPGDLGIPGDWVEDADGIRYFICEATGSGWRIGQKSSDDNIENVLPV